MTTATPFRVFMFFPIIVLGTLAASLEAQRNTSEEPGKKVYHIGIAPADRDTPVESYMEVVSGIDVQCNKLNGLLTSVCCNQHDIGCNIEYSCDIVDIEESDLMADVAYYYEEEAHLPNYPIHHASVLEGVSRLFTSLERYGKNYKRLVVAYTRHLIRVDDEETKIAQNKIDPSDFSFYFLGRILPNVSEREGRVMVLDYYATSEGILMSVSPMNETSLAQALSEYRSSIFSFNEKQFTGTGSRVLFELDDHGKLVPNMSGCTALTEMEPMYYRSLLNFKREAD